MVSAEQKAVEKRESGVLEMRGNGDGEPNGRHFTPPAALRSSSAPQTATPCKPQYVCWSLTTILQAFVGLSEALTLTLEPCRLTQDMGAGCIRDGIQEVQRWLWE